MINQIVEATEEWLSKELGSLAPSFIWSEAEQKEIDEIHDVKRWFDYLKDNGVIPNHFRLEAFTIPRLDSFDGDDILVVYQEGALWTGYPLTRFTSFTGRWNKQGMLDFLRMLFPAIDEVQEPQLDTNESPEDAPITDGLDSWGTVNSYVSDIVEAPSLEGVDFSKLDDLVGPDEDIDDDEGDEEISYVEYEYSSNTDFDDDFEDDFDNEIEEVEVNADTSEEVDSEYISRLLEGINEKLGESILTVEECVQEAIDLASQKKGSKKLVRMMLEVEENLTDLQKQLTSEPDEE
ncbi:hypothetical protein [Bacillus sinesaloumensis]|uniref:hypothetical protein n=1 Tax=Litchfieldia sinesaloumensis TaxID=1926280 RepID=UPI0009886832|nr:hypothetical protein [Bacillus sinesaloumensis]